MFVVTSNGGKRVNFKSLTDGQGHGYFSTDTKIKTIGINAKF